ncbi:hypothetical protein L1987_09610 [Smallanthus sonchifolius]|uniref:Uncharacterized protein n=1 Tax=Smallanthus sonchifolius TaxID=185202 RepID=A0ACB9JNU4_9ASTR|nr:hypothetical protein L1987_09610 [Smallanthus sonchifolius]
MEVSFVFSLLETQVWGKTSLVNLIAKVHENTKNDTPIFEERDELLYFRYNKADIASKEGTRGSSGNLVDMALQWVEKQTYGGSVPVKEVPTSTGGKDGGGSRPRVEVVVLHQRIVSSVGSTLLTAYLKKYEKRRRTNPNSICRSPVFQYSGKSLLIPKLHIISRIKNGDSDGCKRRMGKPQSQIFKFYDSVSR